MGVSHKRRIEKEVQCEHSPSQGSSNVHLGARWPFPFLKTSFPQKREPPFKKDSRFRGNDPDDNTRCLEHTLSKSRDESLDSSQAGSDPTHRGLRDGSLGPQAMTKNNGQPAPTTPKRKNPPPFPVGDFVFRFDIKRETYVFGRPCSVLLSQALRLSTIGAEEFDGRVRDGIGSWAPRKNHKVSEKRMCEFWFCWTTPSHARSVVWCF